MNRIDLHNGWTVQTSRKVQETGDAISTPKFQTKDWYRTSVPMTVVGVQVAAGEFPEPYYAMNLRKIPGIDAYEIGKGFSHQPIPDDSPYAASWWYRTEFSTPPNHQRVTLHFDGINNRANIWINGKKIADAKDVAGAYRRYEFDITPELAKTRRNVVAVEVFAQTLEDLGIKLGGLESDATRQEHGFVARRVPDDKWSSADPLPRGDHESCRERRSDR
jgi:exo-1,4-beta-D-glucosaminidase